MHILLEEGPKLLYYTFSLLHPNAALQILLSSRYLPCAIHPTSITGKIFLKRCFYPSTSLFMAPHSCIISPTCHSILFKDFYLPRMSLILTFAMNYLWPKFLLCSVPDIPQPRHFRAFMMSLPLPEKYIDNCIENTHISTYWKVSFYLRTNKISPSPWPYSAYVNQKYNITSSWTEATL